MQLFEKLMTFSAPFASAIKPPSANLGAVNVLFDNVVVEVAVTVISDVTATVPLPSLNVIVLSQLD